MPVGARISNPRSADGLSDVDKIKKRVSDIVIRNM
jgi:hypothetical protein